MASAATTRDRWDSDLADLLGLDSGRTGAILPERRARKSQIIVGAAAIVGLLAAGVAVERWRSDADADRDGRPVLAVASGSEIGALTDDSPRLPPRADGEQRIVPAPVQPSVARVAAPISEVELADAAPARRARGVSTSISEQSVTASRSTRSGADRQLAKMVAALSESVRADTAAAFPPPSENRLADRERDEGEGAPRRSIVVPLQLLLPSAANTMRRDAPTVAPSAGERAERDKTKRKTEALDALRSLRRQ